MLHTGVLVNTTTEKYYDAIQNLVDKHSTGAISVKMILDETKTSRQTFYNYFSDKYDLMNYVYHHDIYPLIGHIFDSVEDFQTTLYFLNKQLQNKGKYYQKICSYEEQNCFREYHIEFWISIYNKALSAYYGSRFDTMMQHSLMVYITGLTELVINWMKTGCKNITHTQLSDLCIQYKFPELQQMIEDPNK